MNDNLKIKSSIKLKIARILVLLFFAAIIYCAVEVFRGDWVQELEETCSAFYGQQMLCEEGALWL